VRMKCDSCKNNCCIYPEESGFIFCGIKDAERIRDATGLGFGEFLDFSKLRRKTIDACRDWHERWAECRLRSRMLVDGRLLRIRTVEEGRCYFLDNERRCSIYKDRPLLCRIYPFWFIHDGRSIRIIEHDTDPCALKACGPPKDALDLAKAIEEETRYYEKNIRGFSSLL